MRMLTYYGVYRYLVGEVQLIILGVGTTDQHKSQCEEVTDKKENHITLFIDGCDTQ